MNVSLWWLVIPSALVSDRKMQPAQEATATATVYHKNAEEDVYLVILPVWSAQQQKLRGPFSVIRHRKPSQNNLIFFFSSWRNNENWKCWQALVWCVVTIVTVLCHFADCAMPTVRLRALCVLTMMTINPIGAQHIHIIYISNSDAPASAALVKQNVGNPKLPIRRGHSKM